MRHYSHRSESTCLFIKFGLLSLMPLDGFPDNQLQSLRLPARM